MVSSRDAATVHTSTMSLGTPISSAIPEMSNVDNASSNSFTASSVSTWNKGSVFRPEMGRDGGGVTIRGVHLRRVNRKATWPWNAAFHVYEGGGLLLRLSTAARWMERSTKTKLVAESIG